MDIQKIRKILGKEARQYTDEELLGVENEMRVLADLIIDMVLKMTPKERKELNRKFKIRNKKLRE